MSHPAGQQLQELNRELYLTPTSPSIMPSPSPEQSRPKDLQDPDLTPAIAKQYGLLPSQTTHRVNLLRSSGIKNGDRILEIGCGQGDCTSVLAMLYSNSTIDAVDPGDLDYGNPETLGQAQARIRGYDFGSRITFHKATPVEYLGGLREGEFDVGVFCHCLWYFSGNREVVETLRAMRGKVGRLFIAEWGLRSSTVEGCIHVHAAMARAACEARILDTTENIRSLFTPSQIVKLAEEAGYTLEGEEWIVPGSDLDDAKWEIGSIVRKDKGGESVFLERARRKAGDEGVMAEKGLELLENMRNIVVDGVERVGGLKQVRCMDVWTGRFA